VHKKPFQVGDIVRWTTRFLGGDATEYMAQYPGLMRITRVERDKDIARVEYVVSVVSLLGTEITHSGTTDYGGNNWDTRFFELDPFLTEVRRSKEAK